MPFEPRLFDPRDSAAPKGAATEANAQRTPRLDSKSLDLAPELEALAEQLSEDSGHLAQCYPATNPRMNELLARTAQLAEAEARRGSRQTAGATVWLARCGLAASLLLAIGVWWQNTGDVEPVSVALTSPAEPGTTTAATPIAPSTVESEATLAVHESTEPTPMLDPQVFLELDAASQAAVADLVQEGELNQSSLSL
jgi:hypothetical protein